jgi:hypothetical protein
MPGKRHLINTQQGARCTKLKRSYHVLNITIHVLSLINNVQAIIIHFSGRRQSVNIAMHQGKVTNLCFPLLGRFDSNRGFAIGVYVLATAMPRCFKESDER